MSYGLSGIGFLGQAAGDGPKVITIQQVAAALLKKILGFGPKIAGIKISMGGLVPDSIEPVAVNIVASALQKKYADAMDIGVDEAQTDAMGFMLAQEICDLAYRNGIGFTDESEDYLWQRNDGAIWIGLVGTDWRSPGMLASFISDNLEDVVTELTGVDPSAPEFDFGFDRPITRTTVMQEMGPGTGITGRVDTGPQIFDPRPPPSSELPIVPLAIAGIAALFLLS